MYELVIETLLFTSFGIPARLLRTDKNMKVIKVI